MTNRNSGITLIEIMVTIVIISIVLTLGVVSLRGYLPKQNLNASIQSVENAFQLAQTEAIRQSRWTCVRLAPATPIRSFLDANDTHTSLGENGCGDPGTGSPPVPDDPLGAPATLRGRTRFASHCALSGTPACTCTLGTSVIWFDDQGKPQLCGGGICSPADIQIVLSNDDLESGYKAREVEVTEGGLIQIVKLGQDAKSGGYGVINSIWAKNSMIPGGCE